MLNNNILRWGRKQGVFGSGIKQNNNHRPFASSTVIWATIAIAIALLLGLAGCASAAEDVDMAVIAQIESSNNPLAYNKSSGARGLCQITQPARTEFNSRFHKNYKEHDLFNGKINLMIADWYMNNRIPQMMKYYKIEDTVRNRLWAYNAGIGNVVKNRMPEETKNYIVKYEHLKGN